MTSPFLIYLSQNIQKKGLSAFNFDSDDDNDEDEVAEVEDNENDELANFFVSDQEDNLISPSESGEDEFPSNSNKKSTKKKKNKTNDKEGSQLLYWQVNAELDAVEERHEKAFTKKVRLQSSDYNKAGIA